MNQDDAAEQQSLDDKEIDRWVYRDFDDILKEAENEGFIQAAKEKAEQEGWIEPITPEEYLMWFDEIVEQAIKDALYMLNDWSSSLYSVHHIAGYAAELRYFGILPAPKPWTQGLHKIDPEILEGMKTVSSSVKEYWKISGYNFDRYLYPHIFLQQTIAKFNDMELLGYGEIGETGILVPVLMLHNLMEQFTYIALCEKRYMSPQNLDRLNALKNIWFHAEDLGRKPKDIVKYAIEIWQYRIDQVKQGKQLDLEAECAIIFPPDEPTFDSPIEELFWKAWKAHTGIPLASQYKIGKYRVDFAHPLTKVAIELDGLIAHQTTKQIANDRRRQREIEAMGWKVIRFGGKEIYHNAHQCAVETENIIRAQQEANKIT